jgi:hypothetical protein
MFLVSYEGFEGKLEADEFDSLREFVDFALKELVPKELKSRKKHYLEIIHGSLKGANIAETEVFEEYRHFKIHIAKKVKKKNIFTAVAHELAHVKQYAVGQLRFTGIFEESFWLHERYCEKKLGSYWRHPWEIDAYGWEKCLIELWVEQSKKKE